MKDVSRLVDATGEAARGALQRGLRYLLDEREHFEPPTPVVEYKDDEELTDPERLGLEAGTCI